ncbi:transposable element Tcb1 transposase [Trichonephila clavipes]|nr:transposable element Tcb1 transposase [Trichonephila clavipes]
MKGIDEKIYETKMLRDPSLDEIDKPFIVSNEFLYQEASHRNAKFRTKYINNYNVKTNTYYTADHLVFSKNDKLCLVENSDQHLSSVTHHSVSARTIRRRLQQSGLSARRPLLGLPLTLNHRRLHRQWCDERRMSVAEWNEVIFTDESRIYLQHHDDRIRSWRHRGERILNSCVMHQYTGPSPGIMGLATAIFQQENARPHVECIVQMFFVNNQIEFLPWPIRSPDLPPEENMWSMVDQRLTQILPPAAIPDQL